MTFDPTTATDRAPTAQELLTFYLEAGVDCALMDDPVDRLSGDDVAAARDAALPSTKTAPVPLVLRA